MPPFWVSDIFYVASVTCCVAGLITLKRVRKLREEALRLHGEARDALEFANAYLRHVVLLDRVLNEICLKSYSQAHLPIWAAWAASMGVYHVEVQATSARMKPEET